MHYKHPIENNLIIPWTTEWPGYKNSFVYIPINIQHEFHCNQAIELDFVASGMKKWKIYNYWVEINAENQISTHLVRNLSPIEIVLFCVLHYNFPYQNCMINGL